MVGVTKEHQDIVPEHILARLHPLEIKVLAHLKDNTTTNILKIDAKMEEVDVMRAIQWLEAKGALKIETTSSNEITLDSNAKDAIVNKMPELRLLQAISAGAKTMQEAAANAKLTPEEQGACIGIIKKKSLANIGKEIELTMQGKEALANYPPQHLLEKIHESESSVLENLSKDEQSIITELKGRKNYIIQKERKERTITLSELGHQLSKINPESLNYADKLTPEDLQQGTWDKKFRAYDVTVPAQPPSIGKEHFVQEAIEYIKSIWLDMGFFEMEGTIVQSAFWDLDSLFVPQDHPARDTQDTFYLDNPRSTTIPKQIFERVRDAHENGGTTGSKGWRYKFSRQESEQLMLRTHNTVISAQTLLKIKSGELPMPGKYFIVNKVFRNEALDWKHLFEFHQVEGIVVDPNVTFAQLIGYLKIFFAKMGFPAIRLRPHHFPYTEPSVEVDVWNTKKQQWVELGGAGVFRPEVTKTLMGEDVPVLAWGIGLERVIVEYFGLTDLRDLYKNDIKQLREMPKFVKINTVNTVTALNKVQDNAAKNGNNNMKE